MYVRRFLTFSIFYFISWRMVLWSMFTGLLAMATYQYLGWKWVSIPWLPVSLIGTAVAFYVGFKNNQSYDRGWEARKVWGGIVNSSRAFASAARAFISGNETAEQEVKTLVYRHLAWLHALKHALRQRTLWEHKDKGAERQRRYFEKRIDFSTFEKDVAQYLSAEEQSWITTKRNKATQLMDKQSQHIAHLHSKGHLDHFKQVELQRLITELLAEQGRAERIKNTPLPRQYSSSSSVFILIFTLLLPFGMLSQFEQLGEGLIWLMLPFNLIVSWVFSLMEYTGDYSENPFEGLLNDVPVYSIVRNIEIDLRDMLGESDLPKKMDDTYHVLF